MEFVLHGINSQILNNKFMIWQSHKPEEKAKISWDTSWRPRLTQVLGSDPKQVLVESLHSLFLNS